MPKMIANTVFVTGDTDAARELRSFMTTPDSKFDFSACLPMPEELEKSEASHIANIAWQLKYGDWAEVTYHYGPGQFATWEDAIAAARAADEWRPFRTPGPGSAFPQSSPPRSFDDLADAVQSFVVKYGSPDWCRWRCANWGTKWPAVNAGWMGPARAAKRDAEQVAYFDTAWGPPVPVITELSKRYPDVILRLDFFDSAEGMQGFVSIHAGVVIGEKRESVKFHADSIGTSHSLEHLDDEMAVYIGDERRADDRGPALRRSPWTNPFAYCDCSPEEAVSRYRRWLQGDAEVIKQLPPGKWPLPDVSDIRSTFMGKIIVCDCGNHGRNRCPAAVLADLALNRDGEDESLADDECDASLE